MLTAPTFAQDDVVHRRSGIKQRGTVVANDSTGVKLITGNNKTPVFIAADQIDRIEVKLTPQQEEGEKRFEQGDYRGAAEQLEAAIRLETRGWLRGRMQSSLVASYVALGESVAAIDSFLASAAAADSQVPWAAVPVWWLPEPPADAVRQRAASLLRSDNPLAQVIAASYLFGTDQSVAAREVIAKQTTTSDERIGDLARTQLWRWQAETAKPDEVVAWQRQAAKLPGELRGGPQFVIGLALRRLDKHEDAALAFLWPALVCRTDSRLAARATLLAAQSLEQTGQKTEAKQLYKEVIARYVKSADAAAAQSRLDALKE